MQGKVETALSEYSGDHGLPHHLEISMVSLDHRAEARSDGAAFPYYARTRNSPSSL